ncbi:phage tail protein I [Arsenophonus sp. PmNCSU2021_1]|uniref:phage tail protein I n=1 Tax=Arsenophonus sp. PmNCSU2021_1 TaxID=3118989 RepID=UPI002FEE7E59
MTDNSLLPPLLAAESHFQALAAQAARLQQIDLTPLLVYLLDMTEASALPWLAEQLALTGVNGWSLAESDDARRAMLKSAITLHRYKGTPWSIRAMIRALGFGEVTITEGGAALKPEQATAYPDGETHWALYRVILNQLITNDQAAKLRETLAAFAPARSELVALDYTAVPLRYNAQTTYHGRYNHGSS